MVVPPDGVNVVGVYSSFLEGKSDHIVVFACTASGTPQPDGIEIDATAYWPPDDLSEDVSPGTKRRLTELVSRTSPPIIGTW